MYKFLASRVHMFIVGIGSLFIMMMFTACQGLAIPGTNGTSGSATLTGQVQSVNAPAHSVTFNVNGQQITINGLTDQQVSLLQSQQSKMFSIQGMQTGTNIYTISTNTQPQENDNATPGVTSNTSENPNNGVNEPGTIGFIGTVRNTSNGTITVGMPDGQELLMNIVNGLTNLGDLDGSLPSIGQLVKVTAIANTTDGSFIASKLDLAKPDEIRDQNIVKYQGFTTGTVGADNKLNFKIGNKNFSFPIVTGADLNDFNFNVQDISNNFPVKAKVVFNGRAGTVVSVDNENS